MPFPFNSEPLSGIESVTMRDAKGFTSVFRFYWENNTGLHLEDDATDVDAIVTAFVAMSNAALQATKGIVSEWGTAQYGSHAPSDYQSVNQKALMFFQDTSGVLHRYHVPAPKIAIFLNDQITVDPSNSLVSAFVTLMTTAGAAAGVRVTSRQQLNLVNFMGGYFTSAKRNKRVNVLTLDDNLTPSEPQ